MTYERGLGGRAVGVLTVAMAMIATLVVSVAAPPSGVARAVPAPTAPLPACVQDSNGNDGLGCAPGDFKSVTSGTFASGSTFSIDAGEVGFSPCADYVSTGCYYEVFAPSFLRCVYLYDSDPTDVRSCPSSLGTSSFVGSGTAQRQGSCRGELGSTYALGGPANGDPATWWVNRGPVAANCEFIVPSVTIDNLQGPTFFLVSASVDECITAPSSGCDESSAVLERRTGYGWLSVEGDLAPRASFDVTTLDDRGRYSFQNTWVPFNDGTTSYEWDFGDGNTSTATSPTHDYGPSGSYTVRLTMTGSEGGSRTATKTIDYEAPDLLVEMTSNGLIEDSPVPVFSVTLDVTNESDEVIDDIEFDGDQPIYTSVGIPAEARGDVAFVGDPVLPTSLQPGETVSVEIYLEPLLDGFVGLGSAVVGTLDGKQVDASDGLEVEMITEKVTDIQVQALVEILLLETIDQLTGTFDELGRHFGEEIATPGSGSCPAPTTAPAPEARTGDDQIDALSMIAPILIGGGTTAFSDPESARFLARSGEKFLGNLRDGYLKGEEFVTDGLGTAGAFWRDVAYSHLTGDTATRDEMLGDVAAELSSAATATEETSTQVLNALTELVTLASTDEGRDQLAERYVRAEGKAVDTVEKLYEGGCKLIADKIDQIDRAPTLEAKNDIAADMTGDLLTFIFVEGLTEIVGGRIAEKAADAYRSRRGLNAAEEIVSVVASGSRKRPTTPARYLPSDEALAKMSPSERLYWIEKREFYLDELKRDIPGDELLDLDGLIAAGGLPGDDAVKAQQIARELGEKYGVEVELELRQLNPDSLPYWEINYRGPDGKRVLPTPKNELAKAKNGNAVDVALGMNPDGKGRLALYEPISKSQLDDLTRTMSPEQAHVYRTRWNTQQKYWKSYQDYESWLLNGQTGELDGFAKILAESTGGKTYTKKIAVPGRELDLSDPSSYRERTLSLDIEARDGGQTILLNDFTKPLDGGGSAPIVSDADWHATVIKGKDGQPIPQGLKGKIELEVEYRLARETKTFGGHGMSVNGNDFQAGANKFRLEFLYEQLPPNIARRLNAIRNDGMDFSQLITGQRLVKISSSGFSIGYGSLPGAGWVSPGKSKYDLIRLLSGGYGGGRPPAPAAPGLAGPLGSPAPASLAPSVTFNVNSNADLTDALPGDGTCAAGNGACTLRAAVVEANATVGPVLIAVPAGTYRLTIPATGDDDADDGASGDLDLGGEVTINGSGVTIDGAGSLRLFDLRPGRYLLSGLTLKGGRTATDGAAIRGHYAELELQGVSVTGNTADGDAAVFMAGGELVAGGSSFTDNAGTRGGAVTIEYGSARFSGGSFIDNSAADGGAMAVLNARSFSVDGTRFESNGAVGRGGAVFMAGSADSSLLAATMRRCSFVDNRAIASVGGAIFVEDLSDRLDGHGSLAVTECLFSGNVARGGGAVWIDDGEASFVDSDFEFNSASDDVGGAVYAYDDVDVSGSSFTSNTSQLDGPAVYGAGSVATVGATFSGNVSLDAPDSDLGDAVVDHDALTEADRAFIAQATLLDLSPSSLKPLTPARLVETRSGEVTIDGEYEAIGELKAGSVTEVQIAGRGGVRSGAAAVAVNVTAIRPKGGGYVTLFPCGEDQPLTSSLNYRSGAVAGNSGIVKLNAAGELCVFTFADTHLVIDVNAWLAAVPSFESLIPARLVETRTGEVTVDGEAQALGRLEAGSVTEVQIAGRGGVDAEADAVALNVTAIRPAGVGYVTLYPCDEERPTTSSLNYAGGAVVGNSAVVSLSASGSLCAFTFADTDLVLDVNAWLADDASFDPFVPARFYETRAGESTVDGDGNGAGRLDAKSVTTIRVAGRGDVPAGASAVALNVTAVRPDGVGYVTLFPCDGDQPLTSSLNYAVGAVVGNSGVVKLADDGTLCAYTQAGTDLVIDVNAAWAA